MYKILLAEDEPAVLDAMVNTLDWNALGFHIPTACANGRQAIEAMQNGFVPNAVITDICMPFVDGVGLAQYVAENHPQTLVVMLTGYNDFSYAQKAIKLRVTDYILKPITPKSLRQLAMTLCETLDERRIKNTDDFDSLARERFLVQLLTVQMDQQNVLDHFRVHKIDATQKSWLAMAADLNLSSAVTALQGRDNELARYALGNIVAELALETPCVISCVPVKEVFCILLSGETDYLLVETARQLALRIEQACKMIQRSTTCGVGEVVHFPAQLHSSYLQALLALHYRFFFGHVPYILSEQIELPSKGKFDYAAFEQDFVRSISTGSFEKTRTVIDFLFERLQTQKTPYEQCLRYCQRAVLQMLDLMREYLPKEDMAQLGQTWDGIDFFAATTLPQLHDIVLKICELAFESYACVNKDDTTLRVRKAEVYIKEHYNDDTLSLNTIRDEFSISISYFSSIFKAGTGCTFVEYLTQVRIEKAKHSLAHSEKRTCEIACEVGFSDPHYFSVTFKRVTGLTPREYRLQQKNAAQ